MTKRASFKITFRYIVKEDEFVIEPEQPPWNERVTLSTHPPPLTFTSTSTTGAICPDLLSIRDLGVADGWRGVVVRSFFVALWWVTGV